MIVSLRLPVSPSRVMPSLRQLLAAGDAERVAGAVGGGRHARSLLLTAAAAARWTAVHGVVATPKPAGAHFAWSMNVARHSPRLT